MGNVPKEVETMATSLYDRLGGVDAITAVVRDFEDRAAKDDRIKQKFGRTDLARLTKEFVDQVCEATGGPCNYKGRSMKEAHRDMAVTIGEFEAFIEDLVATLDKFKVGKTEQGEILSFLRGFEGEIVEVNSRQVGTALPSTFRPAPALVL